MALPSPPFHFEEVNHPANLTVVVEELVDLLQVSPSYFSTNARSFFDH